MIKKVCELKIANRVHIHLFFLIIKIGLNIKYIFK